MPSERKDLSLKQGYWLFQIDSIRRYVFEAIPMLVFVCVCVCVCVCVDSFR